MVLTCRLLLLPVTHNECGTADFFAQMAEEFALSVRQVETTTDSIRLVAKTPGGIGASFQPFEVVGQKTVAPVSLGNINPLPLSVIDYQDFVPPFDINNKNSVNITAFANGSYPLTRRLFIIVRRGGVKTAGWCSLR